MNQPEWLQNEYIKHCSTYGTGRNTTLCKFALNTAVNATRATLIKVDLANIRIFWYASYKDELDANAEWLVLD